MPGDVDATRPPNLTVEAGQKFQNFGNRAEPCRTARDAQVETNRKG